MSQFLKDVSGHQASTQKGTWEGGGGSWTCLNYSSDKQMQQSWDRTGKARR
jgi:hypothetical protein